MTTTTARAPRRDAAQNRDALIEAARTVLNRDPEAGLVAIAAEAGLTRRAVYGHFANRDALLKEMVQRGTSRVAEVLAAVDHPDPLVRLALIASRMWQEVDSVRVTSLLAVRGPFQAEMVAGLQPVRRHVIATVRAGAGHGVRTDIPAETLAHLIEGTAIIVLDEAARTRMPARGARHLVMLAVLAMAGLDAAAATSLIESTPELRA